MSITATLSNHLTKSDGFNRSEERTVLIDAICEELMGHVTVPQYVEFITTPWAEIGHRSVMEAYAADDVDALRTVLGIVRHVAADKAQEAVV